MTKRRGADHRCPSCGQRMARTQLRPPVFECVSCLPLRPLMHCASWSRRFERFWEYAARALTVGRSVPRPPPWCYAESNLAGNVLSLYHLGYEDLSFYMVQAATVINWRATKAIYRVHPSLLEELLRTEVSGALPVEALMRLPVWCPYVELPDLPVTWGCGEAGESVIRGLFAWLDFLPRGPLVPVLRLVFDSIDPRKPDDCEPGIMMHLQLALEPGLTVDEALARVDDLSRIQLAEMNDHKEIPAEVRQAFEYEMLNGQIPPDAVALVRRLLAVLLYLCAENAEVDQRVAPIPCRVLPGPHGGARLYEPAAPTIVRAGVHLGAQLKSAREAHERVRYEQPRGTVAPHVRAAHWHHFWRGPREGPRELVLRWLAPMFVGLEGRPLETVTVRGVEGPTGGPSP